MIARRHLLLAVIAIAIASQLSDSPSAQTVPAVTGIVAGRVVDSANAPIEAAIVTMHVSPSASLRTPGSGLLPSPFEVRQLTDAQGRFEFRHVPAGSVRLTATANGYGGDRFSGGRGAGWTLALMLAAGQRAADVTLVMPRHAAIGGTIRDDAGDPAVGVSVMTYRRRLSGSVYRWSIQGVTSTDDRGAYRLSALDAGDYFVVVPFSRSTRPAGLQLKIGPQSFAPAEMIGTVRAGELAEGFEQFRVDRSGPALGYTRLPDGTALTAAATLYPSTTIPSQALPVSVAAGEERSGIDITVRSVPAINIAGHAIGPAGPVGYQMLQLVAVDPDDRWIDQAISGAMTDADGSFLFHGVPAGNYVIRSAGPAGSALRDTVNAPAAPPPAANATVLWAAMPIAAGSDMRGVVVTLHEGARLSGRVQFDGSAERADPLHLTIVLQGLDGLSGGSVAGFTAGSRGADAAGRFTTPGHPPGRYLVRVSGIPSGWALRGVFLGGVDIADRPFELDASDVSNAVVVLTDRISAVSGSVAVDPNRLRNVFVAIFPTDPGLWTNYGEQSRRTRQMAVVRGGDYAFEAMPAGDYFLAAYDELQSLRFADPAFLEALARTATRVTVAEGMHVVQSLQLQKLPNGVGLVAAAISPLVDQRPDTESANRDADDAPSREDDEGDGAVAEPEDDRRQQRDARAPTVPPIGTLSISGVVVDDVTGLPVRRARVTVRSARAGFTPWIDTDDAGRFVLAPLPAGTYRVEVRKRPYLPGFHGSVRAGRGPGEPIVLTNQPRVNVDVRLAKSGVITGTVTDHKGIPQEGVRVSINQVHFVDGRRELSLIAGLSTDDRGVYRAYELTPGRYIVSLPPPAPGTHVRQQSGAEVEVPSADGASAFAATAQRAAGRLVGYAPIHYPGTTSIGDAAIINIQPGTDAASIDFVRRLVPMARIEGRLTRADGDDTVRGTVSLLAGEVSYGDVTSHADGTFATAYAPPGEYTLRARIPTVSERFGVILWAQERIHLAGDDVIGTSLELRDGAVITGRLEFAGTSPPPVAVRLWPRIAGPSAETLAGVDTTTAPGAAFAIQGIPPGQYLLAAGPPERPPAARTSSRLANAATPPMEWLLASATLNGEDLLDRPFTLALGQRLEPVLVTLTDRMSELSGRVIGPPETARALFVMLMPADRRYWIPGGRRFRLPVPAGDGYRFTGLPAGDYVLVAVADPDPVDVTDRTMLEQLAVGGIRVTLGDREQKVQDLRVR